MDTPSSTLFDCKYVLRCSFAWAWVTGGMHVYMKGDLNYIINLHTFMY